MLREGGCWKQLSPSVTQEKKYEPLVSSKLRNADIEKHAHIKDKLFLEIITQVLAHKKEMEIVDIEATSQLIQHRPATKQSISAVGEREVICCRLTDKDIAEKNGIKSNTT